VAVVFLLLGAVAWWGLRSVAPEPAMPEVTEEVVSVKATSGPAGGPPEPDPGPGEAPVDAAVDFSIQDLRVLSVGWVCSVIDPPADVLAEGDRRYAAAMKADRAKFDKNPQDWYYAFSKTYHTLAVWAEKRPKLVGQLDSRDYWKVNGK